MPVVRRGMLPTGPGSGAGSQRLHSGDDELRHGERANRDPCRGGCLVELVAALVAGTRRGDSPVRWEEVVEDNPLESRMHLSTDGTGIPMRKEETGGVRGKHEDGGLEEQESQAGGDLRRRGPGSGDRRVP